MSNQQKPATEHTLDAQLKPFFQAWNSYKKELAKVVYKYVLSKKTQLSPSTIIPTSIEEFITALKRHANYEFLETSQEPSSTQFPCLKTVDRVFNMVIKPILINFFETHPLIFEGKGKPSDIEFYNNILKNWFPVPYFIQNKQKLLPLRISLPLALESETDVLTGIDCWDGLNEERYSPWCELRPQVVACEYWSVLYKEWKAGKEVIHSIIDWANSQKENLKELSQTEKGEKVAETEKKDTKPKTDKSVFKRYLTWIATGIALILLILERLHLFEWLWGKMRLFWD